MPRCRHPREAVRQHQPLKLDAVDRAGQLELPERSKILAADTEAVVVQCIVPVEKPEEGAAEAVPGEPEVIGAKEEEEEKKED